MWLLDLKKKNCLNNNSVWLISQFFCMVWVSLSYREGIIQILERLNIGEYFHEHFWCTTENIILIRSSELIMYLEAQNTWILEFFSYCLILVYRNLGHKAHFSLVKQIWLLNDKKYAMNQTKNKPNLPIKIIVVIYYIYHITRDGLGYIRCNCHYYWLFLIFSFLLVPSLDRQSLGSHVHKNVHYNSRKSI